MPIRLVLADDHPLILDGLESLIRTEADFQVLARCVNGVEALQAVRKYQPDVLVLDVRMPEMDGLEVVREIRRKNRPTRASRASSIASPSKRSKHCCGGRPERARRPPP